MSFTKNLKKEVMEKENGKQCCEVAELAGIIAFSSSIKNGYLKITIENRMVARRIAHQLKRLYGVQAGIEVKKQGGVRKDDAFIISVASYKDLLERLRLFRENICFPDELLTRDCCARAFLKGAFLGGGSVANPEKRYHLEFVTHYREIGYAFVKFFERMDIAAHEVQRRGLFVTYFKDCDVICDVLAAAGVNNGVMDIYEVKVVKEKKNELNRLNNSECANICKTAKAAADQRICIEKIVKTVGIDILPESLRKLAEMRMKYPEEGLAQLGQRLNPPIGKSGVNHRMRKIIEISKRY
ncbi:MAG: DNA-binding protein WhiA [Bacillota bacterium]|nr:DNA-binding protein WhiA [Bacillota bacterium]